LDIPGIKLSSSSSCPATPVFTQLNC
jgi:hypothetical protein